METEYFIVRADRAGVFFGKIKEIKPSSVVMTDVQKVWRWDGACAVEQLAVDGTATPKDCKLTVVVKEMEEDMAYLSYDDLFGILKMVNGSYHTAKMHKNDEIDSFDTKSFRTKDETDIEGKYMIARYLSIFFDSSENIMKDSLEYVLKDMVNKNMILLGNGFKTYKKELVNSNWKRIIPKTWWISRRSR